MAVSPLAVVVTGFLGGLLSLDRTAFGQFLLSRPLVSASLTGAILGCPYQGAFVGVSLELLFLSSLPVGSFIPHHPLYPSLVAVAAFVALDPSRNGWEMVPPAILFALPSVWADRLVEDIWRRSNDGLLQRAEALIRLEKIRLARALHLTAILRAFVLNTAAILLCAATLSGLAVLVLRSIPSLAGALALVGMAPLLVGLAGLSAAKVKGRGWLGFAGGLAVGLLFWSVI
ncbi:MAG: PTS sugar transporter subunit IIC [bacterium]|nr:MAG: PTS sugar transporter subunit IIC [bacterium]